MSLITMYRADLTSYMSCNLAINLYRGESLVIHPVYESDETSAMFIPLYHQKEIHMRDLSKAAVKPKEMMHCGPCVRSADAIESRAFAAASKIAFPGNPQC
jgi:hypothetical protein